MAINLNELATADSVAVSEPLRTSGNTYLLWHIAARSVEKLNTERDKITRGVSEDGFVVFTPPRYVNEGPLAGWYDTTGVSYDLL